MSNCPIILDFSISRILVFIVNFFDSSTGLICKVLENFMVILTQNFVRFSKNRIQNQTHLKHDLNILFFRSFVFLSHFRGLR